MKTLVRVLQYGVLALLLHFSVTIYGQSRHNTEFFSAGLQDKFDEIYEQFISVNADNCHIKQEMPLFLYKFHRGFLPLNSFHSTRITP